MIVSEVFIETIARRLDTGFRPDVATTGSNEPILAFFAQIGEVFAALMGLQPLLPAITLHDSIPKRLLEAGLHPQLAFKLRQVHERLVLDLGEFRADIGAAHAGARIVFGILDAVCVMAFDEGTVRRHALGQAPGHFRVEF